ncbi:hypothetical protein EI74_0077 [Mycoplasma testudineum]|uniref:Cof subfamily protein (Haloacid dehalogenase superfamily)/HAD superfamily hydrolase (TIGR01484 family) n=1 Tax=Mycoplasma testudineum TaxID=244584 RepID=A0A4R6IGZ1_9MOLU|nr:HAD family hydrolase [Mycoplasma testudineum]OYD27183.1 hypothetical protein CG473_00895 [Mycoplasma testudineum]TDO21058.1 hypothetical protein EI74_0077 [Mycoplasma testudineum]
MKNIKMIVSDIDRTILPTGDKTFHPKVIEAFKKTKEKGLINTLATGREFITSIHLINQIKNIDYLVGGNGSFIYDVSKNDFLQISNLDFDLTNEFINWVNDKHPGTGLNVIDDMHFFLSPDGHSLERDFTKSNPELILEIKDFVNKVNKERISLIVITHGNKSFLEDTKKWLEKNGNNKLAMNTIWTDQVWFITRPNINKFDSLKWLADKLNISTKDIISFGDGKNDVELLSKSGIGVAVEDAFPEALAATNHRTLSSRKQGVPHYLEKNKII